MELESAIDVNLRPYSVGMISSDTITICPYPFVVEQPKDYVLWSMCNFSFMNACCLGFAALVYSIKARDCKVAGNAEDATRYGKKAKILNIVAIVMGVLLFLLISGRIASVLIAFQARLKKLFDEYKANVGVFGSGSGGGVDLGQAKQIFKHWLSFLLLVTVPALLVHLPRHETFCKAVLLAFMKMYCH